jgi:hypothetical protein
MERKPNVETLGYCRVFLRNERREEGGEVGQSGPEQNNDDKKE